MKTPLPPAARRWAARPSIRLAAAVLLIGVAGCQNAGTAAPSPVAVTRDTPCSLDGMTLADYPGPKAQIVYDKGAPDFFCDTIELFSIVLRPEQRRHALAIYVQDMAQTAWDAPEGHWIDARTAFYVAGSKQRGSMGGTFASFAAEKDAAAFAAREGGKVYRFEQITPQMAELDGGVVKDHQM